jgi:PPOX class probable F420-dependent enzyme
VSRRAEITLSPDELAALLEEERTLICATIGRDGWPHLMPLWYVLRDDELWSWTYAKSQKVRNLERDPRCTVQVEAGEAYGELRGVMIKARADVIRDVETVAGLGEALMERYGNGSVSDAEREALRRQAPKRVALRFIAQETASWDHRKL